MLLFSLGIGSVGNSAYAANTTGASSGQGVATSLSDKWVKITTSGNVAMSVVPIAGDGSLVAAKGTINVQTNSGTGYQLYLSGSLYNAGDANHWAALYQNGDTANPSIASTTATSTAAALAVNEWGYAVPSVSGNGYAAASLYQSAVDGEAITSTTTMNQLKWKGVKGDYQHIFTSTNTDASMATTGEDTDVYYGTRVNSNTDNGNYTNVIIYTAFIDGGTSVNMTPNVLPITTQGATATVTFTTGHQSSSQPVTPSQIEVSLFNSADANATVATCDPSTIAIVSGHDGTSGRPLQFTCTVTRNLATSDNNGTLYDVIVRVDKENNGLYMTYEHQDYWRFITQWNYSLTFNGNNATSGVPTNQTGTKLETDYFSHTLPANPTRTYYTFNNWSDGSSTYTSGNTITLTKSSPSKALTASWNEISVTYTLSYASGSHTISNSSSFPTQTATQNRSAGTTYTFNIPSTTPTTTDDYTFNCWSTDGTNCISGNTITLTSASDSNTSVSQTLTALWTANGWTATINYDANGGFNAPSATTITGIALSTDTQSLTLDTATTPTRSGYTFIGWASAASVPHTTYADGASLTVQRTSPTITVYAEWIANSTTSGSNMQSLSSCNLTAGTLYSMTDSRDSKKYLVARLADGNCWMVQNLAIATGTTLTSSTSDVTTSYTIPTTKTFTTVSGASDDAYYEDQSAIVPSHTDATRDSTTNTGGYYSYTTAVAGTNKGSSGQGQYAPASICPKGWRLPTDAEYTALLNAYSSNKTNFAKVWGSALVGYYSVGSLYNSGSYSYWWSGTRRSDVTYAYRLYMSSSGVGTYYTNRYYGNSVRCVFGSRS